MSEKGLQLLAKQSLIPMAKDKSSNPCDHCLFGKQPRVSFQKNSTRKLEKLESVYYDVCGPMEVDSLGGNKYFVTFIDDASRKTWEYLLHTKSQVFQYFQKFHAMVERKMGNPLKLLRTDNGGEYISREFKKMLLQAWNQTQENGSWYTIAQRCCREDESDHCGKSLVHVKIF